MTGLIESRLNTYSPSQNNINSYKTFSIRDFGVVGDGIADDTQALQSAIDFLGKQKFPDGDPRTLKNEISKIQYFTVLDLDSGHYLISKPLKLNNIYGCIISNGTITASKDFPLDEYLLDFLGINTTKLENLLLECRKRANGIYAHKFFRLRVEDCTILHQKSYGIYGSETGYNHELEIFKCNISEYLWGDGQKNAKVDSEASKFPDFRVASNRQSTGIFLGQADNIVADCNINLCKVGIKVGMRANRIQGNHITAGGTYKESIFEGIVLDKHVKSSCLIVNNYIDNCRLLIRVDAKPVNKRNYVTVTDNLFYRGFNHPEGKEFNHIVIRPLAKNSVLQNIIVSNNQFYTQDEHLKNQPQRVIKPVHINCDPVNKGKTKSIIPSIDNSLVSGTVMRENNFTNAAPYYEIPMGTNLTGIIQFPSEETDTYCIDFSKHIPWGKIHTYKVTMTVAEGGNPVPFAVTDVSNNQITIKTKKPLIARFDVEVDVNSSYSDFDSNIVVH